MITCSLLSNLADWAAKALTGSFILRLNSFRLAEDGTTARSMIFKTVGCNDRLVEGESW